MQYSIPDNPLVAYFMIILCMLTINIFVQLFFVAIHILLPTFLLLLFLSPILSLVLRCDVSDLQYKGKSYLVSLPNPQLSSQPNTTVNRATITISKLIMNPIKIKPPLLF